MMAVMLPAVRRLPRAPGVYRFRGRGSRVLYVGRAVDLRRRVGSYWGDLGDRGHLRRMVPLIEGVEAAVCASAHEAAWLERNLLDARRPPWNRSRGEESAVHLRLDGRARSVGLSVVHRVGPGPPPAGVRWFGPYLGGERARLAIAGLQRVIPAAYTADGLTRGQVDLGRVLGAGAGERAQLLGALRAVLDRDPDAVHQVRAGLARRRDDAAAVLAFERAGRLQDELDAVDWLVAEQRVTRSEPVSHEIAGWAGGVLVLFSVHAGRLSQWTRRRCSAASARPRLAATPPEWTGFAEQNARLAAALADVSS